MSVLVEYSLAVLASGCAFTAGKIAVPGSAGELRHSSPVRATYLGGRLEKAS